MQDKYPETPIAITVEFIENAIKYIEHGLKRDDERQHSFEDYLFLVFTESIAEGRCENPVECAKALLKVKDLDFARWCA